MWFPWEPKIRFREPLQAWELHHVRDRRYFRAATTTSLRRPTPAACRAAPAVDTVASNGTVWASRRLRRLQQYLLDVNPA